MEKIIGNYTGQAGNDFPLDCETLEYIKNNTAMVEVLGNIAGDRAILWGCDINSVGNMSAGYVFVRTQDYPLGEVLYFGGGHASNPAHIENTPVSVVAQEITYEAAYHKRKLVSGYGDETFGAMGSFVRVKNMQELLTMITNLQTKANGNANDISALERTVNNSTTGVAALNTKVGNNANDIGALERTQQAQGVNITDMGLCLIPVGAVVMWTSHHAPPGNFRICDGSFLSKATYPKLFEYIDYKYGGIEGSDTFNLPDMRGLFVVGAGGTSGALGTTGGADSVTLTAAQSGLPAHSHSYRKTESTGNTQGVNRGDYDRRAKPTVDADTGSTGGTSAAEAHENRPPFIALNYVIRVE